MVSSYVQLLSKRYQDQLDSDAQEFISFAVDGAHRIQALIQDLLNYSRVGTQANPFQPADCNSVVRQVITNLGPTINDAGARIQHGNLPIVHGDFNQIFQLVQNLVENAIKYRGEKRPEVRVSAQSNGNLWQLSVSDNGIGFDQKYADQIFNIFQRLHGMSEYSGTGIGLAVSKKIVQRHGGEIWAESSPGKGAAFFFTLPDPNLVGCQETI